MSFNHCELKYGNDKEPTTKCGMLDNGKTSNFEYNTVVTR